MSSITSGGLNGFWASSEGLFVCVLNCTLTLESELITLSPKARMLEPFFQMMMKSSSTSTCTRDWWYICLRCWRPKLIVWFCGEGSTFDKFLGGKTDNLRRDEFIKATFFPPARGKSMIWFFMIILCEEKQKQEGNLMVYPSLLMTH